MSASQAALRERIESELTGPLRALELDVEAVEITPAGRRRLLRVAVDKDGGVTLDDVTEASRAVGRALDASGVMGEQPYTLEVTSRGVDRPLTLPRHWRRNVSRLVRVVLSDGTAVTGRLTGCDDHGADLDVDGRLRRVDFPDVAKALVQVELNRRPAAPGAPAGAAARVGEEGG